MRAISILKALAGFLFGKHNQWNGEIQLSQKSQPQLLRQLHPHLPKSKSASARQQLCCTNFFSPFLGRRHSQSIRRLALADRESALIPGDVDYRVTWRFWKIRGQRKLPMQSHADPYLILHLILKPSSARGWKREGQCAIALAPFTFHKRYLLVLYLFRSCSHQAVTSFHAIEVREKNSVTAWKTLEQETRLTRVGLRICKTLG